MSILLSTIVLFDKSGSNSISKFDIAGPYMSGGDGTVKRRSCGAALARLAGEAQASLAEMSALIGRNQIRFNDHA